MRRYLRNIILTGILFATTACVKESNDDCPPGEEPEPAGSLYLNLDWINTSPQPDTDSVRVAISDPDSQLIYIYTPLQGREIDLAAGTYGLLGWETADNAVLQGRTVSVRLNSDNTARNPEPFAAGQTTSEVLQTTGDQVITLPMRQQTRELVIRLNFTGDGAPLIDRVTGTFDGIAVSRDIDDCFVPVSGEQRPGALSSGKIEYSFLEESEDFFTGSRNLLGIDGEDRQYLDLRVMFSAENFTDMNLDLTSQMDGFHTQNVHRPWVIELYLNVGANFDMIIIDWIAGDDINLIAV